MKGLNRGYRAIDKGETTTMTNFRTFTTICLTVMAFCNVAIGQVLPGGADVGNVAYEKFIDNKTKLKEIKQKEVEEKVTSWGTGTEKWMNFQGAASGSKKMTDAVDSGVNIFTFQACQDLLRPHTLYQLGFPPSITIYYGCGEYHQYPGIQSGICTRCEPSSNIFCGSVYCKSASLIEYFFPAYKIDTSDQVLATPYIEKGEARSALKSLQNIEDKMPEETARNIIMASSKTRAAVEDNDPALAAKMKVPAQTELQKLAKTHFDAVKAFRKENKELNFISTSGAKGYSRFFTDLINDMSDNFGGGLFGGIPHVPVNMHFATDLPLGYSYARFMWQSRAWQWQWFLFSNKLGERTCIRNNVSTGKTPILRGLVDRGVIDASGSCLDNIGAIFPMTANRLPHTTDGAYQTAVKGLRILHKLTPLRKHTYLESTDKWSIIRPVTLRNESKTCGPLDTMIRNHMTYNKANIKEARTSGEVTFNIWPVFKGCWDFKGKGRSYWIPPPGITEVLPSNLGYGELRLD
jgi:hypothetical protein